MLWMDTLANRIYADGKVLLQYPRYHVCLNNKEWIISSLVTFYPGIFSSPGYKLETAVYTSIIRLHWFNPHFNVLTPPDSSAFSEKILKEHKNSLKLLIGM